MNNINELLIQLEKCIMALQQARNNLAELGAERDLLDRLDSIVSNARYYTNNNSKENVYVN